MESISYNQACNSNKDCDSNVCELVYENNKPKGRYCLTNTNNKYTKKCKTNKDCISGECVSIYDNDNNLLSRKCVKAPKVDKDTAFNSLFGGADDSKQYGLMNNDTIALQAGERGPITEILIKLFSIIGNLFNVIVINTDVCTDNRRIAEKNCLNGDIELSNTGRCLEIRKEPCNVMSERPNQGLLYGIWLSIFNALFGTIMKNVKHGLLWGNIQKKHFNESTGKCDKSEGGARGFDLWYIRMILTILFPPFGVFMAKGFKGMKQILICCILTACFYFPGLIYAFSVINTSSNEISELKEVKELNEIQNLN
mgnify:FL=1